MLLQPGKSDAAQVFGGGASSTAFGPRGTQTVLAKITIGAAISFFIIAFLFSVPGLTEKRSLGEGVGPAQSSPIALPQETPAVPQQTTPPANPSNAAESDKNSNSAAAKAGGNKNTAPQSKQQPKPQSKQQ